MISDSDFAELAVRQGVLSAEQVSALHLEQSEFLGKGQKLTLAQLAQNAGVLTAEQVAELEALAEQQAPPPASMPAPPPPPAPLPSQPAEQAEALPAPDPESAAPVVELGTEEQEAPKPRRTQPSSRTHRRTGTQSSRRVRRGSGSGSGSGTDRDGVPPEPPPRRKQDKSVLMLAVIAGLGLLLFAGVIGITLSGKDSPTDTASDVGQDDVDSDGVSDGAATGEATPPPDVSSDSPPPDLAPQVSADEKLLVKLTDEAYGLSQKGQFKQAIEVLERFGSDKRTSELWKTVGRKDLAAYATRAKVQSRFERALNRAKAGDTKALSDYLTATRDVEFAFYGEEFLDAYTGRAREVLGKDAVEALILASDDAQARDSIADAGADGDEDNPVKLVPPVAIEVKTRGNAERRARFAAATEQAQANLEKAHAALAERRETKRKAFRKIVKRVKKAVRKGLSAPGEKRKGKLVVYDEDGFTLKFGSRERRYSWDTCPSELGHMLRKLAADPKDGQQLFELGLYALRRGEFDHAERDFLQATRRDDSLRGRAPNVDQLRHLVKLFRGKTNRKSSAFNPGTDATQVLWRFDADRPQESLDFVPLIKGATRVGSKGGQLAIQSPAGLPLNHAQIRGRWVRKARLEVVPSTVEPRPAVLLHSEFSVYLIYFGSSQTNVYGSFVTEGDSLARGDVGVKSGQRVVVDATLKGDSLQLEVSIDGKPCLKHSLPFSGELEFMIGSGESGQIRFDEVRCTGTLSEKWAKRVQANAPNRLARFVDRLARRRTMTPEEAVPLAYRKTSAEDEVGLEGIPDLAKAAVEDSRALMRKFRYRSAERVVREVAERHVTYHAANYLRGLDQLLADDTQGALIRLRRAALGVENFYEAETGVSEALFLLGRYEESRGVLDKALATRPDYAPAFVALSNHLTLQGKYDEGLAQLEVAEQLAPGDGAVRAAKRRIQALAEGPAWSKSKRVETDHYVLDTNMTGFAQRFASQLEAMRKRYEEAFGVLINPDAKPRRASVLVFSEPEGYYSYSERVSGSRPEDSLGHFAPLSGQLLLYLEDDPNDWNSYHVLYHEGMHQWCNAQGVSLPFWASEGMAEYVGGTRLSADGRKIIKRGVVDRFLKGRLSNLTANWSRRADSWLELMSMSPEQFYAGDSALKYSMAWTIVHFIMEGGDEVLKSTFMDYLKAYTKVSADKKAGLRGGAALQYVYVSTFHQLKMKDVEKRWAKWVEKLAREAGLNWTLPE